MTERGRVAELQKPADIQQALIDGLDHIADLAPEHALIGGIALAYHGVERYTKDVAFAVTKSGSAAVERAADPATVRPLRIGGISLTTPSGVNVDLIDRRFELRSLFEEAIQEARTDRLIAKVRDREIPVVPVSHLVAMKLAAARPQDEADVHALLSKPELDYAKAREVVYRHLGYFAARYLDRMARAAGRTDAPNDYENGDSP
jgi:hypothetical protein